MLSIFGTKWGQTWAQRLVDWWLALIKARFDRAGFPYSEEVDKQEVAMREVLDVKGLCKLAWEGETAIAFIELADFFGGPELFEYLDAEIEAERLGHGRLGAHFKAAIWFCSKRLRTKFITSFMQGSVSTGAYLYQVVGTTWYERAITIPFMAGVVFAVYVLFASNAIAEAQAFWHPPDPPAQMEAQELRTVLREKADELRRRDPETYTSEELQKHLHDAWRYYALASEHGEEREVEIAVLRIEQALLFIGLKEGINVLEPLEPDDNTPPAPAPRPPGDTFVVRAGI